MDTVSLYQLLDSAIEGETDVNFPVLRKLLRAMLEQQEHYGARSASAEPPTSAMGSRRSDLELEIKGPGQESIIRQLNQLRSQVSSLQGLASELQGEKAKIKQLQDTIGKLREDRAKWKADMSDQVPLQLGSTVQETQQELEELGEMNESIPDQLMSRKADQLQGQIYKLMAMVNSMRQEQKAACSRCSSDTAVDIGELLQRYEKLQELADTLESRLPTVGKMDVGRQPRRQSQDKELLLRIHDTVMYLQWECEQASAIARALQRDFTQKEKDIEALFQSVEKLKEDKAEEQCHQMLAINGKADKAALASKVDCTQFEACMERLEERMQEMLRQMSGQEQHWHEVKTQLTDVTYRKLDRLELGLIQKQLEKIWKSIKEIKEGMKKEHDDAAGIKQMLIPYECLSCNRNLNMRVPGPPIKTIQRLPPLSLSLTVTPTPLQRRSHSTAPGKAVIEGRLPPVQQHYRGQNTSTRTVPPPQTTRIGAQPQPLPNIVMMAKPQQQHL